MAVKPFSFPNATPGADSAKILEALSIRLRGRMQTDAPAVWAMICHAFGIDDQDDQAFLSTLQGLVTKSMLDAAIQLEQSAREAADLVLTNGLSQEVSDRAAAILAEQTARAQGLATKANLVGGNTFTSGQQVFNADYQSNPLLVETSNGQGFEFGIAQDTSFIDFHTVTAGNGEDFDSRIIATGDITKGNAALDFETNSLTWGGSPLALQSQLPFSDTGLKMQAFQVKGNNITRVSFPTAFRVGTVPYVFLQINAEPGGTSRAQNIVNVSGQNTPDINNANFLFQPIYLNGAGGTAVGNSTQDFTLNVLVVGYF